jgi:tetratricopeptide (TPR) repeat protein
VSETQALIKRAGELADGDHPDEAMEICSRILLDEPDNPGALYVTASVLLKAVRHVQVIQTAKRIIEVCPKDPRGYGLLSVCYGELHRYDLSIQNAEKALSLKRTDKTLADCCYAHTNAGNWDLASKYGESALQLAESDPSLMASEAITNCRISMGYIRLAQGKWPEGFAGFRNTLRTKWRKERVYDTPNGPTVEWMGEKDAVVVVTGEQGLGDEIMAAGMIPEAAANCRKFVFDCDERLGPLFKRSFPDIVVSPTRRADALATPVMPTHHKTLFGLAELFRQTDESFPRKPFLEADPELREMFAALFDSWPSFVGQKTPVIGIAWSGGLPRTGMEQRKAGLNAFLPLIRRGGAEFVSLEYKDDAAEVAAFEAQHGLKVRRIPWATQTGNMELLAALIAECSEVIGVATTALHLSSALGVPTTIIVNRGLGWQFAGEELLWYPPTTRLWRKQAGQSWRDSVAALVDKRK